MRFTWKEFLRTLGNAIVAAVVSYFTAGHGS